MLPFTNDAEIHSYSIFNYFENIFFAFLTVNSGWSNAFQILKFLFMHPIYC